MKTEKEVLEHNLSLPGHGIRVGLQTTCIARCATGKHVLKTGLGAMGVGTMWFTAGRESEDPDFAALPVEDCHGLGIFFFPMTKCRCCTCQPPTGEKP